MRREAAMGVALKSLAALVVGSAAGLALTWASVFAAHFGAVRDGPWETSLATGSSESGPYLRAYVAIHGLLALNRSETIYYNASRDSGGNALTGNCDYSIVGRDPDARWWSITPYGSDDFLIPNPARRFSVSMNSVARRGGGFVIAVSPSGSDANGLPVGNGPFSLTLRLYNPGAGVTADPAHAALPQIRKESCR